MRVTHDLAVDASGRSACAWNARVCVDGGMCRGASSRLPFTTVSSQTPELHSAHNCDRKALDHHQS